MTALSFDEVQRANVAIRDILFLYRDLTNSGQFAEGHDVGTFNPWAYLNVRLDGGLPRDDVELLQAGSAVALLTLYSEALENGAADEQQRAALRGGLTSGRFEHLPEAEAAVRAALGAGDDPDDRAMRSALDRVYEVYVQPMYQAPGRD